jgi:hypothetical protein
MDDVENGALRSYTETMARNNKLDARMKERQAVSLRLAGKTYTEIAEIVGWTSGRAAAYQAIDRAIKREIQVDVQEVWETEIARLDEMLVQVTAIIEDYETPAALKLQAIDRKVKIAERRAKLMGLDKPMEIKHSGSIASDPKIESMGIIEGLLAKRDEEDRPPTAAELLASLAERAGDE